MERDRDPPGQAARNLIAAHCRPPPVRAMNPTSGQAPAVATAAAVVGAGVLAYVLYRKGRKRQQLEPIEGQARRIGSGEDEGGVASYPRSVRRRRQAAKV